MKQKLLFETLNRLLLHHITSVKRVDCDQGFILVFEDGQTLKVGYSGCEGNTYLNGQLVDDDGTLEA